MYIEVIITGIVGLITTVSSAFVSWLFAKKKYNAEVDGTKIENMQKSLEFYINATENYKKQLDELMDRNTELSTMVVKLQTQLTDLSLNICYNLSCRLRQMEPTESPKKKTKSVEEDK